jgi:hypothetical protein
MLQKLQTVAFLGAPGAFQQAFKEHPVLTPLMAVPILPGGARFGADDASFWDTNRSGWWNKYSKNRFEAGKLLEGALRRLSDRERRIKRKLTQQEVEDVIQQAMTERPASPAGPVSPPSPSTQQPTKLTNEEIIARGQDMLEKEGWTKQDLSYYLASPLAKPGEPRLTDWEMLRGAIREKMNLPEETWQKIVREKLDIEWNRQPKTGPMAGPPDPRFATSALNRLAADVKIGTVFEHRGEQFIRLRRGWSLVPPEIRKMGEVVPPEGIKAGSEMLGQVPLPKQPQTWQQRIVQELNDRREDNPTRLTGEGTIKEYWENGARFIRRVGSKTWTMDPNVFLPPIQRKGNQTIFPRPQGALERYVDRIVWQRYFRDIGRKPMVLEGEQVFSGTPEVRWHADIEGAQKKLEQITGNPQIAHFWLARHIHQRILERKATPAEVVWFNLQRKPPPDEGMAGAAR